MPIFILSSDSLKIKVNGRAINKSVDRSKLNSKISTHNQSTKGLLTLVPLGLVALATVALRNANKGHCNSVLFNRDSMSFKNSTKILEF